MADGLLGGVYVVNVTPFRDDGSLAVDREAYLAHVEWLSGQGVDGIVPFGTNGEGPSVALEEKLAVLEALFELELPVQIVPNVAQGNLPETLQMLRWLEERPVAGVLILPPYYFKPVPAEGLRAFYEAALEATSHPALVYHIPKYAVPVPVEVVRELAVWGVKDSGGDPEYTRSVLATGKGVLLGTEESLWENLHLGAHGIISALANFIPAEIVEMSRRVAAGDEAGGRELSEHLLGVRQMTKEYTSVAVLKRLAEARHGAAMGTVRPPLSPLSPGFEARTVLDAAVRF